MLLRCEMWSCFLVKISRFSTNVAWVLLYMAGVLERCADVCIREQFLVVFCFSVVGLYSVRYQLSRPADWYSGTRRLLSYTFVPIKGSFSWWWFAKKYVPRCYPICMFCFYKNKCRRWMEISCIKMYKLEEKLLLSYTHAIRWSASYSLYNYITNFALMSIYIYRIKRIMIR